MPVFIQCNLRYMLVFIDCNFLDISDNSIWDMLLSCWWKWYMIPDTWYMICDMIPWCWFLIGCYFLDISDNFIWDMLVYFCWWQWLITPRPRWDTFLVIYRPLRVRSIHAWLLKMGSCLYFGNIYTILQLGVIGLCKSDQSIPGH